MTMAGFLPPISTTHGFGYSRANFRYSCPKPTSYEPVNVKPATFGMIPQAVANDAAASRQAADNARRTPACSKISTSFTPDSGVSDDGFMTTVLPATSAAAAGAPSNA